uniref:Ribosome-binding factor A n=1 Tax=Glossina austeni TaxID=7395 RepID=A0A1A9VSZ3_GLOAU
MLRNPGILIKFNELSGKRLFHHENCLVYAKNASVLKQGKILGKLYGNRMQGSKKKWFPSTTESTDSILKSSQFGKSRAGSKINIRRMAVLNKLFMEHITDLMATGEVSETVLGKSLQISRVKISPDFGFICVYWITTGDMIRDATLEMELRECSGVLRHQLTQLDLMGVVPRIKFVKDKLCNNMFEVEAILKTIDFGEGDDEQIQERENIIKQSLEENFYCIKREVDKKDTAKEDATEKTLSLACQPKVPTMRHDVLGLDHKNIMMKILTKMRKSKYAWELHQQHIGIEKSNASISEDLHKKKSLDTAVDSEKFEEFLAKRRDARNTPERKKYRYVDQRIDFSSDQMDDFALSVMPETLRKLYEAEDYLPEDVEEKK